MKKFLIRHFSFYSIIIICLALVSLVYVNVTHAQSPSPRILTVIKVGSGTVTSDDGYISCGVTCTHTYISTVNVTLTATPSAGFDFTGWSGVAGCTGTTPCTVSTSVSRNVTATFTVTPTPTPTPSSSIGAFTLSVFKAGTGAVISDDGKIFCGASCADLYFTPDTVVLTATPSPGYVFSNWMGDCSGGGTCTVTMSTNRLVTAIFTVDPTPSGSPSSSPPPPPPPPSSSPSSSPSPLPINSLVKGWGWSSNIGWISFNSANEDSGGGPHEVKIVNDYLTGYAWSSNIGWIKFGGLASFPAGGSGAGNAHIVGTSLAGWARACAGTVNGDCASASRSDGWDGWIELSGVNHTLTVNKNTSNTAALFNTTSGDITGFAWGSDVMGWIELDLTTEAIGAGADLISTIGISGANGNGEYVVGGTYNLSGTVKNNGTDPVSVAFTNKYQEKIGNGSWSDIFTTGSISSLAVGASQAVTPSNNRAIGAVGTHYFRLCANRPITAPEANPPFGSNDGSNCSVAATMVVIASAGGGGGGGGSGVNPTTSATPEPVPKVVIKVHDDRYGTVTATSSGVVGKAKVRRGKPFDLLGSLDTNYYDTYEIWSDDTNPVTTLVEGNIISPSGQEVTQNTTFVTYRLRGKKDTTYTAASIRVQAVDASINEF